MINLRHLSGDNLKKLQTELAVLSSRLPIVVLSVNQYSGQWFIHYLVQGVLEEKQGTVEEIAQETKTEKLVQKKGKPRP